MKAMVLLGINGKRNTQGIRHGFRTVGAGAMTGKPSTLSGDTHRRKHGRPLHRGRLARGAIAGRDGLRLPLVVWPNRGAYQFAEYKQPDHRARYPMKAPGRLVFHGKLCPRSCRNSAWGVIPSVPIILLFIPRFLVRFHRRPQRMAIGVVELPVQQEDGIGIQRKCAEKTAKLGKAIRTQPAAQQPTQVLAAQVDFQPGADVLRESQKAHRSTASADRTGPRFRASTSGGASPRASASWQLGQYGCPAIWSHRCVPAVQRQQVVQQHVPSRRT